jgi:perosamine synthetase
MGQHDKIQQKLAKLVTLFRGYSVDYPGATTLPSDARDVFRRYRNGEPLLDGPYIAELERALSDYYGGLEAITFSAGRMALYAILKAMKLKPGDEVILPGYTCVVTCNAIRFAELKPVYVDVSLKDFNIEPDLVKKAITKKTKAILVQHTFGIPCDIEALMEISREYGVAVIEDGAHAIGARWDGELLGRFSNVAFFSMEATKMISTERGGFAITSDAELAEGIREIQAEAEFGAEAFERACLLRWCYRGGFYGRPRLNALCRLGQMLARKIHISAVNNILNFNQKDYDDSLMGRQIKPYPARLGNLMAYAGLLQLRRVDEDVAHRQQLADYLESELPKLGANVAEYDHVRAKPSWVKFPFLVKDRAKWETLMARCGFTVSHWLEDPIHPKGSDCTVAGYVRGMCPNGEHLSEHVLNVPVDRRVNKARLENTSDRVLSGKNRV